MMAGRPIAKVLAVWAVMLAAALFVALLDPEGEGDGDPRSLGQAVPNKRRHRRK